VDLLTVAEELYALPPDRFTAERNDRAKAARGEGDRDLAQQIGRLSKPSAAAWAVNMLARHRADVIDQVADLGAALRKAQEDLDSKRLREQSRLRHDLIRAIANEGEQLAEELGNPIGKPAVTEVEQTLQAVMADPDAADAVRTGRLLRSLSSNGIEAVNLDGAVAIPEGRRAPVTSIETRRAEKSAAKAGAGERAGSAGGRDPAQVAAERAAAEEAARREKEERRRAERERAEAKRAVEAAEREVEEGRAELDAIERRIERLRPRRERLSAELDDLREQVAQLERTIATTDAEAERLDANRDDADESVADAEDALERARRRLARLNQE
jgi:DNA repair exonuclease SbcCD ATPase subunit